MPVNDYCNAVRALRSEKGIVSLQVHFHFTYMLWSHCVLKSGIMPVYRYILCISIDIYTVADFCPGNTIDPR